MSTTSSSGGGNAKYFLVGIAFLGAALGLWFIMKPAGPSPTEGPTSAGPTAQVPTSTRPTALAPDELDIPDVLPDAGPAPEPQHKIVYKYVRDDWECSGSVAAVAARQVVAENNAQVRNCYERALKQNNTLQGSLSLQLRIDDNGRVSSTRVGGSIQDNTVFSCVRRLAESWHFPQPSGGRCAVVSAPFAFTPRSN